MSDKSQSKTSQEAKAENQRLSKRLQRIERRMITMNWLQNQNMNLLRALMTDLDYERLRSETLLLNILPELIAHRLKSEPGVIADQFDSAGVLSADIVGFTPLSQALPAQEMVTWLNEIYSAFDEFVQKHEVEKIRTIGDNYMVASGVPSKREDHALAITHLALDMRDYIGGLPTTRRTPCQLPYRHQLGSHGGWCHRHAQVPVRHLGRRRQHRQPHGIARYPGANPGVVIGSYTSNPVCRLTQSRQ